MKLFRNLSVLIFTVALMFVYSSCSSMPHGNYGDSDFEDSIKKSFTVRPGGLLTVDSDLGSIEVQAVSGNKVKVEVFRKVDSRYEDDIEEIFENFKLDFDQRGNDVIVTGEFKNRTNRWWNRGRRKLRLRYVISVPTEYNVDLKTSGGSISVDDLEGEVKSKTSGGSLTFGDIKGPVYGRTSGGSIHIGEVEGEVDAHTSGGSITIKKARGRVVARTSGGSINVEEVMGSIEASTSGGTVTAHISRQPKHRCYLKTSGGSVKVYLAEDIALDIDASTSGGHVETDFPVTIQGRISKRSLRAKINGGGPEMVLKTSGGSIYLRKL